MWKSKLVVVLVVTMTGCATEPSSSSASHVGDCTLVIQQGQLATADKAAPCLLDGDEDAWAAQWAAGTCGAGEICTARCEVTAVACTP